VNIKEYISSGVVESYVLGMASEAERAEFEAMCQQYPEVAQAREAFELALEDQLLHDAVAPPVQLKSRVAETLLKTHTAYTAEREAASETKVRSMNTWKWLAAASLILLVGALAWAISLNNKYERLQQQTATLQNRSEAITAQLNQLKADAQKMQSPTVKMAAMQGTAIAPGAFATVYWDTTSKDVYMMINNLPQPASDKQYQLWALINNQPVDLGVFEVRQEKLLVKMRNVQNAQAFAVTLEPKGGSVSPTLEALYVMGKL
jgi:anti-sigma-K factor RskA